MNRFGQSSGGHEPGSRRGTVSSPTLGAPRVFRSAPPPIYQWCDDLTGLLICFMVVFTPWAFGTTQNWSIQTMNLAGILLGVVWLAKMLIRRHARYRPLRWDTEVESDDLGLFCVTRSGRDYWSVALGVGTVLLLGYVLVSAMNARAVYSPVERHFEYHTCLAWLPHSYDRDRTWAAFWQLLGLASFFWAARDWLLTREPDKAAQAGVVAPGPLSRSVALSAAVLGSSPDPFGVPKPPPPSEGQAGVSLPRRLSLVLWVLCLSGSLLALESILQRLSGTNRLLWLVLPQFNQESALQFGPYAYRANAATYFNLVWPVCLGFWLLLRKAATTQPAPEHRIGSASYLLLLPGSVLMAACPIISTNRGGALVAIALIVIAMLIGLRASRSERPSFRVGVCSLFLVIITFSALLGFKDIAPRFQTLLADQLSRRVEIVRNAAPLTREFPVFGTGPGTFGTLYQLYRQDVTQQWAAYLHDDWLELRITFGWVGFFLWLALLGVLSSRVFWQKGIPAGGGFVGLVAAAMGGALLHAKFDFPFQIYSVRFVFVLLAVLLFSLSAPLPASGLLVGKRL